MIVIMMTMMIMMRVAFGLSFFLSASALIKFTFRGWQQKNSPVLWFDFNDKVIIIHSFGVPLIKHRSLTIVIVVIGVQQEVAKDDGESRIEWREQKEEELNNFFNKPFCNAFTPHHLSLLLLYSNGQWYLSLLLLLSFLPSNDKLTTF